MLPWLILIIVLSLAATPLVYWLRTRRNPEQTQASPGVNEKTFKEWKE